MQRQMPPNDGSVDGRDVCWKLWEMKQLSNRQLQYCIERTTGSFFPTLDVAFLQKVFSCIPEIRN